MPGIAGFIAPIDTDAAWEATVTAMVDELVGGSRLPRGQDSSPEVRASVGWVDDRASEFWPAGQWDDSGRDLLVITGECYGEQRDVVARYEEAGIGFLRELNGRFSGLIIDRRKKSVSIFTDRFGLGRLYVHQGDSGVYFASEAKAILRVVPSTREFDEVGLAEYLTCGCPLQNRTLYRGIELLPAGWVWTVASDGAIQKRRYFDPVEWESLDALEPESYQEALQETFAAVVPRYLKGDAAISLTGGMDSRMIMAWLRDPAGSVPCYSFDGPYRECADVRIARRVAAACGQPYQSIGVDESFFDAFPAMAAEAVRASDGAMDVSGAVEVFANRRARRIAPVRVTGNYGSEVMRCKVAFRPQTFTHPIVNPAFAPLLGRAAETYAAEAAGRILSFIAFKQVPWHHYARFSVEQSQLTVRSPFLDNDLLRLVFQAPPELATSPLPSWRLIQAGHPGLARIPTDRGVTYPPGGARNRLRRAMASFLTKAEYAYDYGMPEWLVKLDRLAAPLHPERLILGQQKFSHFRVWYRDQLAGFVRENLLAKDVLPGHVFDRRAVEKAVDGHLRGRCNATTEIHRLLSVALIQQELLAPPARPTASAATNHSPTSRVASSAK